MYIRKSCLIFSGVSVLVLASFSAAAETVSDDSDDVYHYYWNGSVWGWQLSSASRPNIDITEISYTVVDNTLTVTLELSGVFEDSTKIVYMIYYNTSDAFYTFTYLNGIGAAFGMGAGGGGLDMASGNVTVEGSTLTGDIEFIGESAMEAFWAVAAEYSVDYTDITDPNEIEWWGDWAPESYGQYFTAGDDDDTGDDDDDTGDDDDDTGDDDDDDDDGGTPGFEMLIVMAAVAIALILIRKKK